MATKPAISIVGPGRLGTILSKALVQAGYRIDEVVSRDSSSSLGRARKLAHSTHAQAVTVRKAGLEARLIWLCVPDDGLAGVARELAKRASWKGKIVVHSSGALTSDVLNVLRRKGAAVASVHPLMTFVSRSTPSLSGVAFGVEGDKAALGVSRAIVRDLGGEVLPIRKEHKALYHAWGMFVSPLWLALLVTAEQVGRKAGVPQALARKKVLPIARQTLENYITLGAGASFSGPIVRGDAATVRKHMAALKAMPEVRDAYAALAQASLRFLPARNRKELGKALNKK